MARIAKSKDQANWRKGSEIQIGDQVAVAWDGMKVTATSPVVSRHRGVYMNRTNWVFTLENGKTRHVAGHEYIEGQY